MRSTFRILFYINRSKSKGNLVPIMGRITINGTMAQFSCKCSIESELWGVHENRVLGNSKRAKELNLHLDTIRSEVLRCYHNLIRNNYIVSARMVKDELFKNRNDYKTVLEILKDDILLFAERVGKDRSRQSLNIMNAVFKHLNNYIVYRYKSKHVYIQELSGHFIQGFYDYLIYNVHLNNSTAAVYCACFKKVVKKAYDEGYLKINPFKSFKIISKIKPREFLTENEVIKLMEYVHITNDNIKRTIVQIFLFCCFTGISFADTFALKWENIHTINDQFWIFSNRKKTGIAFQVLLMPPAKDALRAATNGYDNKPQNNIFPCIKYSKANRVLKAVAGESGINKNITWHMSRHTFATLALTKGMSIESVSKILGHTNINTTQIYAKIINEKLTHEFHIIEQKLKFK